jgi:hypothetical protein
MINMYYILSLAHTKKSDKGLTLWRPDNADYTEYQHEAGLYAVPEKGYHDSEINMPIEQELADKLFIPYIDSLSAKKIIPNCKVVWDALKVKMSKNGLKKIKK